MLDTPDLLRVYGRIAPVSSWTPETHLAFGLAMLNASADRFSLNAAHELRIAMIHAKAINKNAVADLAASRLYVASKVAAFEYVAEYNNLSAAQTLHDESQQLLAVHGDNLLRTITASDSTRIAVAAGRAENLDAAIFFFDNAIATDPKHYWAYFYRAETFNRLGNSARMQSDLSDLIRLADERLPEIRKSALSMERGRIGFEEAKEETRILFDMKSTALAKRGVLYLQANRLSEALQDGMSLISFDPGNSAGYLLAGLAETELREFGRGREYIEKAIQLEPDPEKQAELKKLLADK